MRSARHTRPDEGPVLADPRRSPAEPRCSAAAARYRPAAVLRSAPERPLGIEEADVGRRLACMPRRPARYGRARPMLCKLTAPSETTTHRRIEESGMLK